MPVLALQGIRGGVGTTSVAAALAWALQQLKESVLVIDFSPDNLLRLHFNMPFDQPRGWAKAEIAGEGW
jgi:cellulose biosynthesis protein BcsQ